MPVSEIPLIRYCQNHPGQIGMIVADMDAALRTWGTADPSRSNWRIWTYGPQMIAEQTYLGEPSTHSMRLAMNGSGPQLELIEPLTGPSIYHTWLEEHGPGMHHLGFYVDNCDLVGEEMNAAGFPSVQTGRGFGADGTGVYAYFDTRSELGFYLEAIEVPAVRRTPEIVWPDDDGETNV
jgi:methylmalonyl-CoA/ethylmalonyl-CoA epimerase